jgi:transposase
MKFKPYEQHQLSLLPPCIDELVSKDHFVRFLDRIVEQLDFKELYGSYSEEGNTAYHPKMLIKILIYAYTIAVRSSRQIESKLMSDIYFMYLSGGQKPNFRTISDFRKDKGKYFKLYFKEVLQICRRMGMASLGHVSIDGSKIKANGHKSKNRREKELRREEYLLEQKIREIVNQAERIDEHEDELYGEKRGDELPEELQDEKKMLEKIKQAREELKERKLKEVNITEPEAHLMKTNNGGYDVCYNAQISVDSDKQIITAAELTNQGGDNHQLVPIYEKTIQNNDGSKPKEISTDSGYFSGENYLYLEKNKIDAYIPDCKLKKETDEQGNEIIGRFDRRNFKYDQQQDEYICPEGRRLVFRRNETRKGVKSRHYESTDCSGCKYQSECVRKSKRGNRQIQIYENDDYKIMMRRKLRSEEGKKKYNKRMATVEPVFAHIKNVMNFRSFLLRGMQKANYEFTLICLVHNLKKLHSFMADCPA